MTTEQRLHLALRTAQRSQASVISLEGEGKAVPASFPQVAAGLVSLPLKVLQVSDFTDLTTAIRCLVQIYFSQSPGIKSLIITKGNCTQLMELKAGLDQLPELETLNLSEVALGRVGIAGLIPYLQTRQLRYLNLSACRLEDEGLLAVAHCFQGALAVLQTLVLSFNQITSMGMSGLQAAMCDSRVYLENLDLSYNSLEDSGLITLLRIARSLPLLHSLQISRCNIKAYGIRQLANFLASDGHLRELNMADNLHCGDWMECVASPLLEALHRNASLRVLVLSVPQHHLAQARALFTAVTSTELDVKYELIKLTYRPCSLAMLNGNKEVLCVIFECLWGARRPRKCILLPVLTHCEKVCNCSH